MTPPGLPASAISLLVYIAENIHVGQPEPIVDWFDEHEARNLRRYLDRLVIFGLVEHVHKPCQLGYRHSPGRWVDRNVVCSHVCPTLAGFALAESWLQYTESQAAAK